MYYQKHIFFCTNQRADDKVCCQNAGADALRAYAKERLGALEMAGKGAIRISASGCLGRCKLGPVLVIYPEGAWYRIDSREAVDRLIQRHLIQGESLPELLISD